MAKMYYTLEEALAKLACDEKALKDCVREGKLREFRDAGNVNYKVNEIDDLAASGELSGGTPAAPESPPPLADDTDLSASLGPIDLADSGNPMPDLTGGGTSVGMSDVGISLSGSGTLTDESLPGSPTDGSGIDLTAGGMPEDMVNLEEEETEFDGTKIGKGKDDTVVSSVGVSVFDDEDLDEDADPMAKTVMSGTVGGTGLEDLGSGGSGLLDLTRESDDTSLGAELLDEIYPGGDAATVEMGDATRAGLESPITEDEPEQPEEVFAPTTAEGEPATRTVVVQTVEYPPDMFSHGVTGLIAVATFVSCFTGLVLAAMIRGVWPSILDFVFDKLWMFGLGALLVAGAAMGVGVFLGKRSEST